jgi:hypothetical protein
MNQKEKQKKIDLAIIEFRGQLPTLEAAIGAWLVGEKFGWKVLYLVHDKSTLRKYEKILDVNFKEILPDETPLSTKSLAFEAVQKVSNFWKAVKGEIPNIRTPEIKK